MNNPNPFQTFVTVKSTNGEFLDGSFNGPMPIAHETENRIWVVASVMDDLQPEMTKVTDGDSVNADGSIMVSVPKTLCTFHTDEEAESIAACMKADAQLLSYAR